MISYQPSKYRDNVKIIKLYSSKKMNLQIRLSCYLNMNILKGRGKVKNKNPSMIIESDAG